MHEQERLKLIREIEDRRGSRLITYITIDRLGSNAGSVMLEDVRTLERHIQLCLSRSTRKLDLFLHTPGGYAIVPWALVSLFREYLGHRTFNVLIASRAFSAGTKIALGADEIVMTAGANLGPVDSQIGNGIGVEDLRNYFTMAESLGLGSLRDKREQFKILSLTTHPVTIGSINRTWTEGERAAIMLLRSRRKPLHDKANRAIADFLLKRVGLHGQSIRRTEARQIGISFVKDAEEFGISGPMARLFDAYEQLLQLDVPFAGGGWWDEELDTTVDQDVPVALVESDERLDIAYGDPLRHWRRPDAAPAPAPAGEGQKDPAPVRHMAEAPSMGVHWKSLRGGAQP